MAKVVCFGEIMLRLAPPGYLRFEQAARLMLCMAVVRPTSVSRWPTSE